MLLGVGLALIAVTALRPFSTSIPSAVMYFMTGALLARLLGLAVDGSVPKQCLRVAVEAGVMTRAALWLWRAGAAGGLKAEGRGIGSTRSQQATESMVARDARLLHPSPTHLDTHWVSPFLGFEHVVHSVIVCHGNRER